MPDAGHFPSRRLPSPAIIKTDNTPRRFPDLCKKFSRFVPENIPSPKTSDRLLTTLAERERHRDEHLYPTACYLGGRSGHRLRSLDQRQHLVIQQFEARTLVDFGGHHFALPVDRKAEMNHPLLTLTLLLRHARVTLVLLQPRDELRLPACASGR
jgi:hypothetical protein